MEECEKCGLRFTLGINLSTCVGDNGIEAKICNYCSDEFFKNNNS